MHTDIPLAWQESRTQVKNPILVNPVPIHFWILSIISKKANRKNSILFIFWGGDHVWLGPMYVVPNTRILKSTRPLWKSAPPPPPPHHAPNKFTLSHVTHPFHPSHPPTPSSSSYLPTYINPPPSSPLPSHFLLHSFIHIKIIRQKHHEHVNGEHVNTSTRSPLT